MKKQLTFRTNESTILNQSLLKLSQYSKFRKMVEIESIRKILKKYFHIFTRITYEKKYNQQTCFIYIETIDENTFLEVIKLLLLRGDMLNRIERVYWMKKNCTIQDENQIIWKVDYYMGPSEDLENNE